MTESRLDKSVMVFVLCLGVLLLLLQVASSPTGHGIPPSIIALCIVTGLCATIVGTIRSHAVGWAKSVVKVVGTAFALMAVWLVCDAPPDYRTALLDVGLAVVLLVTSFHKKTAAEWTTSDELTR